MHQWTGWPRSMFPECQNSWGCSSMLCVIPWSQCCPPPFFFFLCGSLCQEAPCAYVSVVSMPLEWIHTASMKLFFSRSLAHAVATYCLKDPLEKGQPLTSIQRPPLPEHPACHSHFHGNRARQVWQMSARASWRQLAHQCMSCRAARILYSLKLHVLCFEMPAITRHTIPFPHSLRYQRPKRPLVVWHHCSGMGQTSIHQMLGIVRTVSFCAHSSILFRSNKWK